MNLFRLKDGNYTHQKFNGSALLPVMLLLVCFAISPMAQAVVPAPDGGYPGGNTAEGQAALLSLTTGGFNTAAGWLSLRSITTGSFNTAIGAGTLFANTADQNTATGTGALLSNTTGAQNTANGAFSLFSNTEGDYNTASGDGALFSNTTGDSNTAIGWSALALNTDGGENTANGLNALFNNTSGSGNTATGAGALASNTTGNGNTAVGAGALAVNQSGAANTAVGTSALLGSTGNGNIALGSSAGINLTTGSNNIYIGHAGVNGQNNSINIGAAGIHHTVFINGIFGANTLSGVPVYIDANSQLGTVSSSQRFKQAIQPMDRASEAVHALQPVSFYYKNDATQTPQFGLIAEDVDEVNPDLVVRDKEGKPYSVRYDQVNAMLLNEFLKEHRRNEEQEATIARMQKQIEALTTGLQKVSAQLEMSKPAQQVATNDL